MLFTEDPWRTMHENWCRSIAALEWITWPESGKQVLLTSPSTVALSLSSALKITITNQYHTLRNYGYFFPLFLQTAWFLHSLVYCWVQTLWSRCQSITETLELITSFISCGGVDGIMLIELTLNKSWYWNKEYQCIFFQDIHQIWYKDYHSILFPRYIPILYKKEIRMTSRIFSRHNVNYLSIYMYMIYIIKDGNVNKNSDIFWLSHNLPFPFTNPYTQRYFIKIFILRLLNPPLIINCTIFIC